MTHGSGSPDVPAEVAPGLWCWYARHPEWHPAGFGDVVTSYAIQDEAGLLLVDPLVTDATLPGLDALARGRVRIAVTIPYHVRSSERLADRFDAAIYGHPACASRLASSARLVPMTAGSGEPGGAEFHGIGRPRRQELPLRVPAAAAVVFGDSVATVRGQLRIWEAPPDTDRRRAWYERRYLPTLAALADMEPARVLVTHGTPVLVDGAAELRRAFSRPPWSRQRDG
jgi:glyoxylase-like metal-dependent hydrolase (beta-lactamase superfamily II)